MRIVHSKEELQRIYQQRRKSFRAAPVFWIVISTAPSRLMLMPCAMVTMFMYAGIMEHIEEAGVHSGDSACVLPPHSLPYKTVQGA
jgi:carbamoyl-phosphate synthase large subunit